MFAILSKHDEPPQFTMIGFDTGISVAYQVVGLQFPLSNLLSIISVQLTEERMDLHQPWATRSKELIFEQALKKASFKLREQVLHLSLTTCATSPLLPTSTPSFFNAYDGKLKYLLDLSTTDLAGVSRCLP